MSRELSEGIRRGLKMFLMRLRCSDTVRDSDVTKNSNLMRYLDTFEGIQPITGRVSVTSDTL